MTIYNREYIPEHLQQYFKPAPEIGLEATPEEYVANIVAVFREVRRVLSDDGTLWLNLGDSYTATAKGGNDAGKSATNKGTILNYSSCRLPPGLKAKDLVGIPWMVAFALRADGWYLRSEIIWAKPSPMPESVTDRPTKAHETIFLLSKSGKYYYDAEAIKEPVNGNMKAVGNLETRNKRSVWTVNPQPFTGWTETSRRVPVAWDAPVDGKKRIESSDCPIHGDQAARVAKEFCGEREADSLNRTSDIDNHRELMQQADYAPIAQPHVPQTLGHSSDSLPLLNFPSAIDHSIENHRTGHVPATTPACTSSAETPSRIDCTSAELSDPDSVDRKRGSSISESDYADGRMTQTADGIADRSSVVGSFLASHSPVCSCAYYVEKTEKTSHFATFPPDLIKPCILAGAPKGGTVLDPFNGSGTTTATAKELGRKGIGIDLNPAYLPMQIKRIQQGVLGI